MDKFDDYNWPNKIADYWVYIPNPDNRIFIDEWEGDDWVLHVRSHVTHYKEIEPHELPKPPKDL